MRRIVIVVTMLCLLLTVSVAFAATRTVDGDRSDWLQGCTALPGTNSSDTEAAGVDGCTGTGREFVWTDAAGDERTDFANPDTRVDITELRITGDTSNIYFLVQMNDIDLATGDGAPQVQVAVDVDRDGTGEAWFGGFADTKVADTGNASTDGKWEYLLITRFGSGNTNVRVWAEGFGSSSDVGSAQISAANDVIEFSVPWSTIGGGPSGNTYRFTVSTYRANTSDDTWDIGGSGTSNALDVVTTTGPNTWDEVSDQVVNYNFDVTFDAATAVSLTSLQAHETRVSLAYAVGLMILAFMAGGWLLARHRRHPARI